MPITPFHYPLAYLVYKFGKQKLSLPALIVGSMLPDLEIPVMALLFGLQAPNRMVLHSLLGGVTIGTVIGVAITVLIYPTITSAIFRFSKSKVKDKCRFSPMLVFSCLIGVLSHVLLDVTNHSYNPVFWPFLSIYQTPSPIVSILGGLGTASPLMHGVMISIMAIIFIGLFFSKRGNFWEQVLIG
ncbi:MAG TPA: DUF4184 family protein [Candidatus Acidoferrales bacterium]|nr:DUF4184 family protein [Candidatus Acidoferrales bacterium]